MLYHPIISPFSALLLIMILLLVDQVFFSNKKFSNNSLLLNTEFAKKLKTHIKIVKSNFQETLPFQITQNGNF